MADNFRPPLNLPAMPMEFDPANLPADQSVAPWTLEDEAIHRQWLAQQAAMPEGQAYMGPGSRNITPAQADAEQRKMAPPKMPRVPQDKSVADLYLENAPPNQTFAEQAFLTWPAVTGQAVVQGVGGLGQAVGNMFDPSANSYEVMPDGKKRYLTPDKIREEQLKAKATVAGQQQPPPATAPVDPTQIAEGRQAGPLLANDVANLATSHEDEYITTARRYGMEAAAQRDVMDRLQSDNLTSLKDSVDRIRAAYAKVDLDMANLKIDPNRWEKETPAFTQALMLIGAGAFGFITKGRTANPIMGLLDRAIQKDVDAQMMNYQTAMERNKLRIKSAEDMEYARQKIQTAMWNRAVTGLNNIVENGKTELGILNAQYARDFAAEQLKLEYAKLYGQGQKAFLQDSNKGGSAQGENDLSSSLGGIQQLETLRHFLTAGPSSKGGRLATHAVGAGLGPLVTTSTEIYKDQQEAQGRLLAKAILGGNLSDQEGQAFINKLPNLSDNNKQQAEKFLALTIGLEDKIKKDWARLSPLQKEKMQDQVLESLQRLSEFKKGLAQWAKQ